MGVRFILGRAGTGKTHRCLNGIAAAMKDDPLGPPIFLLVPKQATFTAERQLTTAFGLGAFSRCRVVSFDSIGRFILDECGGSAVPEITTYGRQMILGLLLRQNQPKLKFFSSVARQAGLAIKLDATFGELERCGQGAPELAQLAADVELAEADDAEPSALSAKLHDLHLIYDAYCSYLGQERLDPHRRLQQVLSSIERCTTLGQSQVCVDGFLDFSEHERQVLAAMARNCRDMEIALLVDPESPTVHDPHALPDELSLFHKTEEVYRRLYFALTSQNVVVDAPVLLRKTYGFVSPELAHVEQALFTAGFQEPPEAGAAALGAVELIEAPDRRTECDAVASRVRDLLANGYRLRDVTVLVREPDPYMELLSASFREHELPHFLDRRRPAAHHPVLQFLHASLQLLLHPYPHDAMMTLAKSGLAGLEPAEADELENYVLTHRVRGSVWSSKESWHARRAKALPEDEDLEPHERVEVERIDALRRRLSDRLGPFVARFGATGTFLLRELVGAVYGLFESFGVPRTLADWTTQAERERDLEQLAEHQQVWAELVALFDQMCELLGDEQVTVGDFIEILESGLETFDLGLAPPTVDQVLVGLVDRSRASNTRVTIVVGLNEGVFPRATREDSVLTDAERRELRARRVETDPDSVRRQLDESLLGYVAFTRSGERLIVTRSASDEAGKPLGPSVFWQELRAVCPRALVTSLPASAEAEPSRISTPRQLVTALMRWVREGDGEDAEPTYPSLYSFLATAPMGDWRLATGGDSLDVMRYRAWHALTYSNTAELSPEMRKKLFPSPLTASASQIETFAACPFKHFARYGLRLQPREQEDPTVMDLGTVYHETLDRLVKSVLERKLDWTRLTETQARDLIEACAAEVGKTLRNELMLSNARNRYLLTRIRRTIEKVAAAQKAMAGRGKFLPAFTELTFGFPDARLPALLVPTPHGHELRLRGKIDRVDLLSDAAFSVVDYKMSDRKLNFDELRHGLSVQLLTYLLVVDAHGERLAGRKMTPAAAFYVKLLRGLQSVDHPSDGPDPAAPGFHLRHKPRGIVDADFATTFDSDLQPGIASEVIAAYLKKDGTFSTSRGSDCCTAEELRTLLRFVHKRVGELADQIIEGAVTIQPYKMATTSACVNCDYRSVCRFHVRTNRYLSIPLLGREETLRQIMGGGDGTH